jgi:ATP-dependent helicase HrpA
MTATYNTPYSIVYSSDRDIHLSISEYKLIDPKLLDRMLPDRLMVTDRYRCAKLQSKIRALTQRRQACDKIEGDLAQLVESSLAAVAARRERVPAIEYPAQLPVSAQRQDILRVLRSHQVIIVAGDTGSGKTTQLPKLCLEAGFGIRGRIGHTQPRRIAATSVADRIAEELHSTPGELVGYQVRFNDRCGPDTLIKLMTDGILLAEIQSDRYLNQYDALIIDEAHERSLNIDFLLGYLKKLLPARPELKVIITSATIDVGAFSRHFDNAPIVEVSGRSFPVAVHYLPQGEGAPGEEAISAQSPGLGEQVLAACRYIVSMEGRSAKLDGSADGPAGEWHRGGDVLVFLPGERDIRECAQTLRLSELPDWDVLPLYARLGRAEQSRVFDPRRQQARRIVLATNVAETSLTVPGIRYVVDTGLARVSRYSHRSRVQRLPIEAIAQANAEQRKGRCGRVAPGICIRLYSEDDFNNRPEFTDSEIQRTNLASVILQLARMRFGDVQAFPFLEAPDERLVKDGYRLLQELGAVDQADGLTPLGQKLACIPADPRIARMLLAAAEHACLDEVLIIAAALSIQDPRERPLEKRQAADQAHARFLTPGSDFMALVKLWRYFEEQRQQLSKSQLRKLCQREFLSSLRMFEWRDLHHQLRLVCRQLGLRHSHEPAEQGAVHRAVLAGLVSHVGQRDEGKEYRGARNRRFVLFPGSQLAKKPPPWIVATELVDTGRLFARVNGSIEPEWLIDAAPHLVRREYSEPQYSPRQRAVMARETVSLYGLTLSDRKRVAYGNIDPVLSRQLFIRGALVEGLYRGNAPFWRHNQALIDDIQQMETQLRRHDLLVDDEDLLRFYDERLPDNIYSVAAFDKWRKLAERADPRCLFMRRAQLLRRDPGAVMQSQFPDELEVDELTLPLRYTFAPGNAADGVSVTVPLAALKRLPRARFEWLVPGLLRDKCIELVKALPKIQRKRFVPVPDCVDRALPLMRPGSGALTTALGEALCKVSGGMSIAGTDWQLEKLDAFYRMHFAVIDGEGKVVGSGRDLDSLTAQFADQIRALVVPANAGAATSKHRSWDLGAWQTTRTVAQGTMQVDVFCALVDHGDGVVIECRDTLDEAHSLSRLGMARLCLLAQPQPVKALKKIFLRGTQAQRNKVQLQLGSLAQRKGMDRQSLWDDFLLAVFAEHFMADDQMPQNQQAFDSLLRERGRGIYACGQAWHELLLRVIELLHQIHLQLAQLDPNVWQYALDDIQQQLQGLVYDRFLLSLSYHRFAQYPRYLQALHLRLEGLAGHYQKDLQATGEIAHHVARLCAQDGIGALQQPQTAELARYRWLLEEYRVSLFAQKVGASEPVSGKRMDRLWQEMTR